MSEYTREEMLRLIEENGGPEGLDLSGKDLSGIDLGREAIKAELKKALKSAPDEIPVWYSEKTGGINLGSADLRGANLDLANLQWARLAGVKLQGANLVGAKLQEAYLVGAKLQGANLWLACLQGANLDSANLQEANLQSTNFQGADLVGARLREAILVDADLQGGGLEFANLQEANLLRADLREAKLLGANLQGARLRYSHLEKVDFFAAKSLEGAYFYNVFLDDTRLNRKKLGEKIGEELEGKYDQAKEAYLALKNNFAEIGRYEDAAWAYCKERRMEKEEARQRAHWRKYITDQFVEWICDYGESVPRVLRSMLVIYALFTVIYGLTWSVIRVHATPTAIIREPTRNLVDLARFSLGAMTTMELAGLEPRNGLVELLAGLEALLGIALTGLLGFVVGNRIRRS